MTDTTTPRGTVRPLFRILGYVVGPLMAIGGLFMVGQSIYPIISGAQQHWWVDYREILMTGLGSLAMGLLILRAARTGRDPYVIDDE